MSVAAHRRGPMPSRGPVSVIVAPAVSAQSAALAQVVGSVTDPKMASLSASTAGQVAAINFRNGQYVQKGRLLVQLDNSYEKAQLAYAKAKAVASSFAYKRSQQVSKGKIKGLNVSPFAQQDLVNYKATYLQDQASVAQAQATLDKRAVVAPFAGKVGAVKVSIGDYVTQGTALVSLVNYQKLQVSFSVAENRINQVHLGQKLVFNTPVFPGKKFSAVVTFMAPAIETDTRTLACIATVDNSGEKLRPGLFVRINLKTPSHQRSVQVPEQALVSAYPGYVVYSISGKKAIKTPVTIGQRTNGMVTIKHGLKAGQQVVISGQDNLSNGQAVAITSQ